MLQEVCQKPLTCPRRHFCSSIKALLQRACAKIVLLNRLGVKFASFSRSPLDTVGYDRVIDYKSAVPLAEQLQAVVPEGADIVYDNVGGAMLGTLLGNLAENARVILCGAVSQYERLDGHEGVDNMWELITKRARAEGFMFSDYVDRYPEAIDYITAMLKAKSLVSPVNMFHGIETAGQAFIDMLEGKNLGKCLVKL